ncbi:hypothetical protein Lalb_Chr22g0349461 [Lupinus albus]|uniref:Secreted protein n=1 Tax=Lupinus albus TaxID=3870 RepID=A0A6A4NK13_LUPAL|nr:hypothetical protein Lalb_Chr22g0349461 [Lupinus albus]
MITRHFITHVLLFELHIMCNCVWSFNRIHEVDIRVTHCVADNTHEEYVRDEFNLGLVQDGIHVD